MRYKAHDLSFLFARLLVLFWALWWSIAFITDLLGVLQHAQILSGTLFDSNYPAIKKDFAQYGMSPVFPIVVMAVILIWEFLSAAILWVAVFWSFQTRRWLQTTLLGFMVSVSLWLFFFIGDQIFITFDYEANGMIQGGFQLLSLILILLLENSRKRWWQ